MDEDDGKVLARLFLRSGQTLEFRCTKLTTKKDRLTGTLIGVDWTGGVNAPLYLDVADIVAVQ